LLTFMTPLPYRLVAEIRGSSFAWETIPEHTNEINRRTENTRNMFHERQVYRRLIDTLFIEEPKLVYVTLLYTHGWRWHQVQDDLTGHGEHQHRIDLYPDSHHYQAVVMLNMIDMVLEHNPDAVIVLQADHGIHLYASQMQFLEDGLSEEEVFDLMHSVFSAVRIPERYGGLVEPLHPLNITRELVNRFVGENYELLPQ